LDGVEAFRRNSAAMFQLLPRHIKAARVWQEDGFLITLAGPQAASFNGVLVLDEKALNDESLVRLETLFASEQTTLALELCSYDRVPSCHALLSAHGYYTLVSDQILIKEGPFAARTLNPRVEIRLVNGAYDAACYEQIMLRAFEMPAGTTHELFDAMIQIAENRLMMAWLDGNPVGCGMLLYCAGIAAIYNVGTLPSARRSGVGTAMMYALHQRALDDGYGATVLSVQSAEGLALYKALGYRQDGYQLIFVD
jgi:ribosomal protein S18 acetylase RimI-like enzyme